MISFLTDTQFEYIKEHYTLPIYVYSEEELEKCAQAMLQFPSAFGHTVRFAMKANSNKNILRFFSKKWIQIDASSYYEVKRALLAWIAATDIQLSSQELPSEENLKEIIQEGVFFVATSLHQIEVFGELFPGKNVWVRINPLSGSGAFKKISTGGKTSGFWIWYEYIPQVLEIATKYNLKITKFHQHIGSENTPESWVESAKFWLNIIETLPDVEIFDMGGGFKMAIMPYEKTADLQAIGEQVKQVFFDFEQKTGRQLKLEIEPGKYLVINTCSVIAKVVDIVDTGSEGYTFIKVNTGMTEMPRPTMYGVQQPIYVAWWSQNTKKYVVIGHCCESGDLLTCKLYEQETIEERELGEAKKWDMIVFDGAGAYNASMSMKNYNSFPEAGELLVRKNGEIVEIRKRQTLEQMLQNEITVF